jgi:hypothetical protein
VNGVEERLIDLVQVAETPLYSAYCWLGRQLGRDVSMREFLRLVDDLVRRETLCLWSIDPTSEKRSRLLEVPKDIKHQYAQLDSDGSFDPFALSVTLGPAAQIGAESEWEVDLDFQSLTFQVRSKPEVEGGALRNLADLYPDTRFVETRREAEGSGWIAISGRLELAN